MDRDKTREALKEQGNLIGLASSAGLALALLNPLPLLVGLVAETAYLLFVPDTPWYTARVAKKQGADIEGQRIRAKEQALPLLRIEMRNRYVHLEQMRAQIAAQQSGDGLATPDMLTKLNHLLDKFLQFAQKEQEFRNYLQSLLAETSGGRAFRIPSTLPSQMPDAWVSKAVDEVNAEYDRKRITLSQKIINEPDTDSRAVLQKSIDVLARRQEHVGTLGKTLTNLNYQMQLLEETFGLINDEVRARSPEQVTSDIDDVVTQADVMAKTLEEMAPFEAMAARA